MYRLNCRHQNDDNVHVQTRPWGLIFQLANDFILLWKYILVSMNQQRNLSLYLTYASCTFTNMTNFSTYLEEYMWAGGKVVEQKEEEEGERRKR